MWYLGFHQQLVPSVRKALIPQLYYVFLGSHSLSTRLMFSYTHMSTAVYNEVLFTHFFAFLCPRPEGSASDQFFIVLRIFPRVLSSYRAHEWYALMISCMVLKYFFLSDTWAVSRVGKATYSCTVVWACRCLFTVSHPMLQKTILNASVFFFYKKSVLSPCACVIFLLFLIIQEVCGTCQVCVLSRRYVLELSEPSQSVDAGLFSSQMNYLLLFNYFLSSICSILSSWMPFIFIMGFLDVPSSHCIILQDFHHLMFLPFIFHDLNLVSRLTAFSCNSLLIV